MQLDILRTERVEGLPGSSVTLARHWGMAVAALTLLALGLRLLAINQHSFWYDEAHAARMTDASYADLLLGRARDEGNPPLYWLLLKGWSALFGQSEIGLRSLSALCSVFTVPLLAVLGRRLLSPAAALLGAGLLAISPLGIELANETKTYALLHFLAVLNSWYFVRWVDGRRGVDLALYSLTTTLTCASHYYGPAVPLAHLAGLVAWRPGRRLLLPWLGAMAVAGLLWTAWLPAFVEQLCIPGNVRCRLGDRWLYQFPATPVIFSLGRTFAWRESAAWMLGLALLGALVGFCWPAVCGLAHLRRQPFAAALLGSWCLIPILGPFLVALVLTPLYHTRYGSLGMPAFLLLAGEGLNHFRPPGRRAFLALIVALTAISLVRYYTLPLKDDWRAAVPVILADVRDDEPVLFDTDYEVIPFQYYARRFGAMPARMIGLDSPAAEPETLRGFKYEDGRLIDEQPREYTAEVFSAPGIWLALCVPQSTLEGYEALFRRHGYTLVHSYHFKRIDVSYFSRKAAPEAGRQRDMP